MAFDLYVITDQELSNGKSHLEIAELALKGGADAIQIRDKICSGSELYSTAKAVHKATHSSGALCIINDRLDIALAAGVDGVHLGQEDLPLSAARVIAPRPFIIGLSVGTVEEAVQAEHMGADYLGVGPIYPTGSKPDAGPALGLETLRAIRAAVSIPLIAIGGINRDNASEVIRAGADGLAVISAVVSQSDITHAACSMKEEINHIKVKNE